MTAVLQKQDEPKWLTIKLWAKSHLVRNTITLCGRTPPYYLPSHERVFTANEDKDKCKQCDRLWKAQRERGISV